MTKVKICGITNLEDALLSAELGADNLGFNFYKKSPRYILPDEAREVIGKLPPEISTTGVFVNEDPQKIADIAKIADLTAIQLHGEESPGFLFELKTKMDLEIIKAFRVGSDFEPEFISQYEADSILLDAFSPKEYGGTGNVFDWEIAKRVREIFPRMYLAGGIDVENVTIAIDAVEPYAIDACSGLEEFPGKKNHDQLRKFLAVFASDDR
ncbi:MAG: phosphoribosylanthranilate isomerase [Pyrinomonadaceae bacterium]